MLTVNESDIIDLPENFSPFASLKQLTSKTNDTQLIERRVENHNKHQPKNTNQTENTRGKFTIDYGSDQNQRGIDKGYYKQNSKLHKRSVPNFSSLCALQEGKKENG